MTSGTFSSSAYRISTKAFMPYALLFFFFYTLSADLLHIKLFLFKVKINHLLAFILFFAMLPAFRLVSLPRSLYFCFLWILASLLISSCFSPLKYRSFGYVGVYLFEFFFYFMMPIQWILRLSLEKVFSLYWLSFQLVGCHALFQLLLSCLGILDPFVTQILPGGLARPSAMTYEPSYYALYMCSFVTYFNTLLFFGKKSLFSLKKFLPLLWINFLFLLPVSTGAFFSYIFFMGLSFFFSFLQEARIYLKRHIKQFCFFLSMVTLLFFLCFPEVFSSVLMKFFLGEKLAHSSFAIRWGGFVNAWNIFLKYPLFGKGIGGVGAYLYQKQQNTSSWKNLSLETLEPYDPTMVFTEVLASLGLFGAISLLFLAFTIFRLFQKFLRTASIPQEKKQEGVALFLSLLTSILLLQTNQGLFRTYLWVHTAMNVGFFLKMRQEAKKESPSLASTKAFSL